MEGQRSGGAEERGSRGARERGRANPKSEIDMLVAAAQRGDADEVRYLLREMYLSIGRPSEWLSIATIAGIIKPWNPLDVWPKRRGEGTIMFFH